jgi:hypothetical protein
MNKQSWPRIKAVVKNGKPSIMVDARIAGKGERRFFASKAEAEGWAQRQRVKRQNEGDGAFDERELSAFGWSIKDAIRFALNTFAGRLRAFRLNPLSSNYWKPSETPAAVNAI